MNLSAVKRSVIRPRALVRAGPAAVAHGNRGRASPRRVSTPIRQTVVRLYQATYRGLNHQHFCALRVELADLPVQHRCALTRPD
jgi:hypothetical protein